LLRSLVTDPFELAAELASKDRQRIRRAKALSHDIHVAWSLTPASIRSQADHLRPAVLRLRLAGSDEHAISPGHWPGLKLLGFAVGTRVRWGAAWGHLTISALAGKNLRRRRG
jgi:hypothetical protein